MSIGHLNLPTVVKEESQYEAEINAAAEKIREAIRREAANAAAVARALSKISMRNIGEPNAKPPLQLQQVSRKDLPKNHVETVDNDEPNDADSQKGHFGWGAFGKTFIPYILRRSEKYCALRMVEMELQPNHLNFLRSKVSDCTNVQSYYITVGESRLLNEINFKHLDCKFSIKAFTVQDKIITLADANELAEFLHICYDKWVLGYNAQLPSKCGFMRLNNDSERLVAYIVRGEQRLVPWFYFEGENIENMRLEYVSGWDFSYFKFCFKVQGVTDEYYPGDSLDVVNFTDIQKYFNEFEDYWPNVSHPLLASTSRNKDTSLQQWRKTELQYPPPSKMQPQQALPKVQPQQALPNVQPQQALPKVQPQPALPKVQPQQSWRKVQPQPALPNRVEKAQPHLSKALPPQLKAQPQQHMSNFPGAKHSVAQKKPQQQPSIYPRAERNVAPKNNREVRKYSPYVTATVQRQMEPNTYEHQLLLPTLQNYNRSTYTQAQHYHPQQVMMPTPIFNPGQVMFLPTIHYPNMPNPVYSKPPPNVPNRGFNVIAKPPANVPKPKFNVIPRKQLSNTVPKPRNVNEADVAPKNNRGFRKSSPYSTDTVPRSREMPRNVHQALTKGWLQLPQTAIYQNLYPIQPEEVLGIAQFQSE